MDVEHFISSSQNWSWKSELFQNRLKTVTEQPISTVGSLIKRIDAFGIEVKINFPMAIKDWCDSAD